MYAVTVTFEIKPDQIEAFLPLMIENARLSRETESGCHQFDVCRDGNTIFLYELYTDRAAFDLHLQTSHFKSFDQAAAGMIATKSVALFDEVIQ